jgi:hypothetical protein
MTGIWPLVSMPTFEAVTGPKTDDWLVQTVGVLAAAIGATLLYSSRQPSPAREALLLSGLSALGFLAIDVVFVFMGVIDKIYLVDAVAQVVVLLILLFSAVFRR